MLKGDSDRIEVQLRELSMNNLEMSTVAFTRKQNAPEPMKSIDCQSVCSD